VIESFKYGFFGSGEVTLTGLCYASGFAAAALLLGVVMFNRTEQTFMDSV
jgi:lipopolysaccharide transport system permease protein